MSTLGSFSPPLATVVKLFAASFRAAPTADLLAQLSGVPPAQLLNLLFDLKVAQSPFAAYASTSSDAAFAAAWVDTVSAGVVGVDATARSAWVTELTPLVRQFASRGDFAVTVLSAVEAYRGSDARLVALKSALAARAETAAAFAQSAAGAVYDGLGWAQLTAALQPPPPPPAPTYVLSTSQSVVGEGQRLTFTLQTTHVAAGTLLDYTLVGTGIAAADVVGGQLAGRLTIDAQGVGVVHLDLANDATTEGVEVLRLQLAGGLGQASATIADTSLTVPPPPATYTLSASVAAVDEGGTLTLTLVTTQVPPGTVVPFGVTGSGITAADIVGGQLMGNFTLNAAGIATATLTLAADRTTEGTEPLEVALSAGIAKIVVTLNDTSQTPPPPAVPLPDLVIVGTQGGQDLALLQTATVKQVILGDATASDDRITVKIGHVPNQTVVALLGFERLGDPPSDDVYDVSSGRIATLGNLLNATTLVDNDPDGAGPLRGTDHDTIRVGDQAVGFNGAGANTIDLDNLGAAVGGFNFDFDVLDITKVTAGSLLLRGGTDAAPTEGDPDEVADNTDEVVLGALAKVSSIADFEAVVLSEATVAAGTSFVWNAATGTLTQGGATVAFGNAVHTLSFGGTMLESTGRNGNVPDVTTGVTVAVSGVSVAGFNRLVGGAGADQLSGGGGVDILHGGAAADLLDGGSAAEVRTIQLGGVLDIAANTITLNLDGVTYTVNESAAPADLDPDAGDNLDIMQGLGSDAVGMALATLVMANLDELNASAAFAGTNLVSLIYSGTTNSLTFTFVSGVDVAVTDTIVLADTDGGTFVASPEAVISQGGDGGSDSFVFSSTAAGNGADIVSNFVAANGASDDLLDFTAFLGTATPAAGAVNFAAGVNMNAAANIAVAFGKATLAVSDVALTAAAGKLALGDEGKAVVLVTADANGLGGPVDDPSDLVNQPYLVYFVVNGTVPGLSDVTVTLVGTLHSASELSAASFFVGTDAFVP